MEVLTLQLGHYANYVGAHYWNIQDELAAQEGTDESRESDFEPGRLHHFFEPRRGGGWWQPRLVLVDCKGALLATNPFKGAAEPTGQLEGAGSMQDQAGGVLWDYGTEYHQAEPIKSHPFQEDLEAEDQLTGDPAQSSWEPDVHMAASPQEAADAPMSAVKSFKEYDFSKTARSWTDFLKIQLPLKCVHELQSVHHEISPFSLFFDGLVAAKSGDGEAVGELLRKQVEVCDQLDATQVVFDAHNGFGGVSDIVLRWLQEEQPKCGKLLLAAQPHIRAKVVKTTDEPQPVVAALDEETSCWVSSAFSFAAHLAVGVDSYVPLPVPLWDARQPSALPSLQRESHFESSALLASAWESVSIPYRMRGGVRPSQFMGHLTPSHRPLCGLRHALPLPLPLAGPSGAETLLDLAPHLFDLTGMPLGAMNPHSSLVLRGADPRRLVGLCSMLPPSARRLSFVLPTPLPLPVPFPQVFSPAVSTRGAYTAGSIAAVRSDGEEVEAVPTASHLHAGASAGRCEALKRMTLALKACRLSSRMSSLRDRYGVEDDEFREVLATVADHLECSAADCSDQDDDLEDD